MYYAVEAVISPNGTELIRLKNDSGFDLLVCISNLRKYWIPMELKIDDHPDWKYVPPKDWTLLMRKLATMLWRIRSTITTDGVICDPRFSKDLISPSILSQ